MLKFPANRNLEIVLQLVVTVNAPQLILVVLQRKYSPGRFDCDNFQDQTDAAVEEAISLFNTVKGAELGAGRTA